MFRLCFCTKVVRFGKLFRSDPQKSYPFWKTEFGCKVTKNSQTDNFLFLKIYKNHQTFDIISLSYRSAIRQKIPAASSDGDAAGWTVHSHRQF